MTAAATGASSRTPLPLWVVIAGGGLITAVSLGVRSTFGLFLDPVIETLGTTRGSFGLAVAVQNIVWGFSQPIAGAVSDRFGASRVLATGAVLYAVAMWLMSRATSAGALLLSAGFLVGIAVGAASFAVVLSSVGRMATPEKRSVALGSVSALGSLGQFALIPLAEWQIADNGWRDTAILLALIVLVVIVVAPLLRGSRAVPGAATAVDEPVARPLREDLRRARYSRSYWLLNGGFLVCGFHVTFIGTHLKSYAVDLGQSGAVAAVALSLIGLFNVFGSFTAGVLGARYSNTHLLAGIYGLRAIVIALYVVVPGTGTTTIMFGAAIGTLWLATVPLTSAIVTKQFGTTNSGALFGVVFLSHQVGSFFGAWMGGTLADATGSYTLMWWIAVALGVAAMAFHLMIDEGPVADPPEGGAIGVIPATAMAALFIAVVGFVAIAPTRAEAQETARATDQTSTSAFAPAYCHFDLPE